MLAVFNLLVAHMHKSAVITPLLVSHQSSPCNFLWLKNTTFCSHFLLKTGTNCSCSRKDLVFFNFSLFQLALERLALNINPFNCTIRKHSVKCSSGKSTFPWIQTCSMKQFIPSNIVESLISDLQRWWTVKTELQSAITESALNCPRVNWSSSCMW